MNDGNARGRVNPNSRILRHHCAVYMYSVQTSREIVWAQVRAMKSSPRAMSTPTLIDLCTQFSVISLTTQYDLAGPRLCHPQNVFEFHEVVDFRLLFW